MEESCRIYLCATKTDLLKGSNRTRVIDYHNTTDFSEEINAKLYETSSKSGENIVEMFQEIANDFVHNQDEPDFHEFNQTKLETRKSKNSCCGGGG